MLNIQEIRKNPDGLKFEQNFDLAQELQGRNAEILDVKNVTAKGKAQYEDGLYFLDYELSYTITLASSRSMEPVDLQESYLVNEIFVDGQRGGSQQDLLEEDLVLPIEGDRIDLAESVADNILLNIPLKILTPEEEAGSEMPTGNDWQVMTEEEYQQSQKEKKEVNSPFAGLQGLFDE
ncbi:DUF177 domain-containing protein [Streptococcus sinensis]|uniref:Cluster with ribosomal protein L32p, Firmicutes subfamily n=1 Tax=Streptococcus sinensis TaxID=176090 RepID=A0A0A0DIH6_9STRE|nr:DUF177 domain-containing protein [Streptococcus sinensis]KGM37693.1 cluster with ribosomal protein L32p, Firmicutes subfamily [Streptococcus sinensis]